MNGVPLWRDVTPRLGVSYDVFGTGKTAVKFSIGKYLEAPNPPTYTRAANPAGGLVQSATRTWADANGDFVPQANELGQLSQANFGNSVITTRYADEVLTTRSYNWEAAAQVQHEIVPRVAINAGYFRRWYGNLRVTDNLLVAPSDYTTFCVKSPLDSRLPGGGGYDVCGLANVSQAKFGQTSNLISLASHFGEPKEIYNGVDITTNVRLPRGIVVSGGPSIGRVETDNCFVVDSPQELLNCDTKPPFQPNVKLLGVYPLPWGGIQTAATFQSLAGPQITASRTYTNAEISAVARPQPVVGRERHRGGAPHRPGDAVRGTPLSARLPGVEDLQDRGAPAADERGSLQRRERQLDSGNQHHVRRELATSHERAAGPSAQVRRAVRFLGRDEDGRWSLSVRSVRL